VIRLALIVLASVALGCSDEHGSTFDAAANDASSEQDGFVCTAFCAASFATVVLDVGCVPASVADASLTGACAPSADAGDPFACPYQKPVPINPVPFKDCTQVYFNAPHVGTCHVALGFDDGFSYTADVEVTQGPSGVCCAGIFTATPDRLVVSEPDASCADAGDAD